MSFLDSLFDKAIATELGTTGANPVNVGNSAPPSGPGQALISTDGTHAEWQALGDYFQAATELATVGSPVNVSEAAAPATGRVLMAVDSTHAVWQDVTAAAIVPPNPIAAAAAVGFSPFPSREDHVHAHGAQTDETMHAVATALANGFLDKLDKAKLDTVIEGADPTFATLAEGMESAFVVDLVKIDNGPLYGNSGTIDGVNVAAPPDEIVLTVGQTNPAENGFWLVVDGAWTVPVGYPDPEDIPTGTVVIVENGDAFTTSAWVHLGEGVWRQIFPGSTITAGASMSRVGNVLSFTGLNSDAQHGNRGGGALHAVAVAGGAAGFISGSDQTKLNGIAAGAAALTGAAASQITVQTAAAGVATVAARGDHVHSVSTAAPVALSATASISAGSATSLARSDHIHSIPSAAPSTLAAGGSNTTGSSASFARADHVHQLPSYGSGSGTICQGNDSRLSDDRTASGLRTASNVVNVSAAAAPTGIGQVLTTTGTTAAIWSPLQGGAVNNTRISSASGSPLSSDGTFTTVYLQPWNGMHISLFIQASSGIVGQDGTYQIALNNASLPSVTLAGHTAGTPVDVFAYAVNTSARVALELVNWTNSTTRATALSTSPLGFNYKSTDATRRYVGTILPSSATQYVQALTGAGTSPAICGIWNADNRVPMEYSWQATTGSYTIGTAATWLVYDGVTTSRITGVCGVVADSWHLEAIGAADCKGNPVGLGIGADSTTSASGFRGFANTAASTFSTLTANLNAKPSVGVHNFYPLVYAVSGTTSVVYGTLTPGQLGLTAMIPC